MMHRRDLLNTAVAAGAASVTSVLSSRLARGSEGVEATNLVDTNVSLFHWPFRRLPLDESNTLIKKLRELGIRQAWAGSFEGLLHRDIAGVNRRLCEACATYPELLPIGSVNLDLPGWEDDLRCCIEQFQMPGIRLHPNYHGYTLADPRFRELLVIVASAGLFCQIAVAMEDVRTQHPLVRVADVDLTPLPGLMAASPRAKVQLLNGRLSGALLSKLAATPGVYFDTARSDGTDGVARLLHSVSASRVMLGTHAPFLIPEASLIRIVESGVVGDQLRSIISGNAEAIISTV